MTVRVRFAPSPTGGLHVGGARTALYNWLFARHNKGTFILRIEDTDIERSTDQFTETILDGMKWLGLTWDEGPFYQSQRMDMYKSTIKKLLDEGKAYKCYCTAEELEANREACLKSGAKPKYSGKCRNGLEQPGKPFTIRFKAPQDGTTSYHDICRGTITFENKELDDLIIARSDGSPTYNLTVVVDDVSMDITHIIRGDDHINNTPRQIMIYQALGHAIPEFAHLPMILGEDKKKLSKRHGATFVTEYEDMGFLPEAMLNYLARLGWSYKDQEIFSVDELIKHFELEQVGKSSSVFDMEKFTWVNGEHLKKYSDKEVAEMVIPFLKKENIDVGLNDATIKTIKTERERGKTLKEIANGSVFYFKPPQQFDEAAVKKWLDAPGIEHLKWLKAELSKLDTWDEESIGQIFKNRMDATGEKMLKVAQPVRVALTGTTVSPGIYEVLAILGKKEALERFEKALNLESIHL